MFPLIFKSNMLKFDDSSAAYTLQPVVTSQPFYFKDSFSLKQELDKLVLLPNASIISFDAISMYTNFNINDSIKRISTFLAKTWDNYDCKAVKEAIEIMMKNNRMKFGNIIYHQIRGVANLYVAIYQYWCQVPFVLQKVHQ
jgi:hypothetical protein